MSFLQFALLISAGAALLVSAFCRSKVNFDMYRDPVMRGRAYLWTCRQTFAMAIATGCLAALARVEHIDADESGTPLPTGPMFWIFSVGSSICMLAAVVYLALYMRNRTT